MQWGERHLVDGGPVRLFSHAACGTGLDAAARARRAAHARRPRDVETRPGPGASPAAPGRGQPRAARARTGC